MIQKRGREVVAEAVVLKSSTSGENDILVDFLSPSLGRLRGIARHGRKSQKRFGTILESFNWVQLRGRDAGGLISLSEAVMIHPWRNITTSLPSLTAAFHAVELIRRLVPERSPETHIFSLLTDCLLALDQIDSPDFVTPIARFEYRLLEASGYTPNLKKCLSCGKLRSKEEVFSFVYKEGGLYCASCLPAGAVFEPFRLRSIPMILSKFIEYQLGRPVKTRKFLSDPVFCG